MCDSMRLDDPLLALEFALVDAAWWHDFNEWGEGLLT